MEAGYWSTVSAAHDFLGERGQIGAESGVRTVHRPQVSGVDPHRRLLNEVKRDMHPGCGIAREGIIRAFAFDD